MGQPASDNFSPIEPGVFERFGGEAFFEDFAREFYLGVEQVPALRAMYPEADLAPAQRRFQLFLQQYWGGPTAYSKERGHPRLRMRHAEFPIDSAARDSWLRCARLAWESTTSQHNVVEADAAQLWAYLEASAHAMTNTFDEF